MYAGYDYIRVKKIQENSKKNPNIFQLLQQREIGHLWHINNFVYKRQCVTRRITVKEYWEIQRERKRKYPWMDWKHV